MQEPKTTVVVTTVVYTATVGFHTLETWNQTGNKEIKLRKIPVWKYEACEAVCSNAEPYRTPRGHYSMRW